MTTYALYIVHQHQYVDYDGFPPCTQTGNLVNE